MLQKKDKSKILFFRESSFEIAKLIFDFPNKVFHLREIAKKTGFSTTAVAQSIAGLQRFDIVRVEKTDVTTNIRANLDSDAYLFYKKVFNLYRLERHLVIHTLKETFNPDAVVLFGSYAKGEDIEESDIDVLILTRNKPKRNLAEFIAVCEKELNRKINLHVMESLEKSSNEFRNAAANGTVLYGYLKVV
jgi:predicted nucleotidyltransferase